MSLSCPIHPNANLIEDHRAGDVICPECGLVIGDRLVDVGTEWRSFSNEKSGTDPSRVGAPENPLFNGGDLSTNIAVGFRASDSDMGLVSAQRRNSTNADRQMQDALGHIREMSERIHLDKTIQAAATRIAKRSVEMDLVAGRSPISIAAAAIFLASQASSEKRSAKEIGEIAGAAEITVKQTYRLILTRANELFPEGFKFSTPITQLPTA